MPRKRASGAEADIDPKLRTVGMALTLGMVVPVGVMFFVPIGQLMWAVYQTPEPPEPTWKTQPDGADALALQQAAREAGGRFAGCPGTGPIYDPTPWRTVTVDQGVATAVAGARAADVAYALGQQGLALPFTPEDRYLPLWAGLYRGVPTLEGAVVEVAGVEPGQPWVVEGIADVALDRTVWLGEVDALRGAWDEASGALARRAWLFVEHEPTRPPVFFEAFYADPQGAVAPPPSPAVDAVDKGLMYRATDATGRSMRWRFTDTVRDTLEPRTLSELQTQLPARYIDESALRYTLDWDSLPGQLADLPEGAVDVLLTPAPNGQLHLTVRGHGPLGPVGATICRSP